MGWEWRHLDRMQIICTSLQTDNHKPCQYLTTQFLQVGCPSCRPTNSVKAPKVMINLPTKFELHGFIHSKDMMRSQDLKKVGHVTLTTPI